LPGNILFAYKQSAIYLMTETSFYVILALSTSLPVPAMGYITQIYQGAGPSAEKYVENLREYVIQTSRVIKTDVASASHALSCAFPDV
jgi:hypothetical protein